MVNPVTVSHDRTRPLTNNSGHCLETRTGPHLDGDETVSPDSTTVISNLTTANSSNAFHDSTRLLSKTSGHCFETNAEFQLEDVDTAKTYVIYHVMEFKYSESTFSNPVIPESTYIS
jgi:hypothetical protein